MVPAFRPTSRLRRLSLGLLAAVVAGAIATLSSTAPQVQAQSSSGTLTLRADVQEANALTGVITARGNVQIEYPARDIYATAAQAQYFGEERRIILSGNVVVNQEGNRLEAETVTYLIDEGRFVALPQPRRQVRATYSIPEPEPSDEATPAPPSDTDGGTSVLPDEELLLSPIDRTSAPPATNSN